MCDPPFHPKFDETRDKWGPVIGFIALAITTVVYWVLWLFE
jgi:hypothetical protein